MKNFKNKTAVVTGAASGIGRAIAERCVQEGAHVVLADIEAPALQETERALTALGGQVLAVQTDVADSQAIARLADAAYARFGAVQLLFNNAGVAAGSTVWESTLADWQWVIGINLSGVFYGIREFVPRMLAQNGECHIINTASMFGLISGSNAGVYKATKHAVVSLSETLCCELADRNSKIKVSVLCPAWVRTRILQSERNRDPALQNPPVARTQQAAGEDFQKLVDNGMAPQEVAGHVFDAIRNEQFYILPHPEWKALIEQRMQNILQGKTPM
jgi:NAD(P)-dependent dehydrogenase (short-subunit alcohol dehydrogenase family)